MKTVKNLKVKTIKFSCRAVLTSNEQKTEFSKVKTLPLPTNKLLEFFFTVRKFNTKLVEYTNKIFRTEKDD
jgi:hypothetical protein